MPRCRLPRREPTCQKLALRAPARHLPWGRGHHMAHRLYGAAFGTALFVGLFATRAAAQGRGSSRVVVRGGARAASTPPPPPCLRPAVEVHRINGQGVWTGPLSDCEGRPTLRG